MEETKKHLTYIQASSLRELIERVNTFNHYSPEKSILKDDIVEILKEEGTFILLYYEK